MSFSTNLKLLRISHKLDQETMSKRLNVSQPVYSRYEKDKKEIKESDDFVKRVCEEFDVTIQWLFNSSMDIMITHPIDPETSQLERNYNIPREILNALLKQQQITESLVRIIKRR